MFDSGYYDSIFEIDVGNGIKYVPYNKKDNETEIELASKFCAREKLNSNMW